MVRVADTSALYAVFSETDTHHAAARRALGKPDPVLVPAEILSETLALIHYRHGFEAARRAGDFLRQLPHVDVLPGIAADLDETWDAFARGAGRLSYPDATVVATARRQGARLLAYDDALKRAVRA